MCMQFLSARSCRKWQRRFIAQGGPKSPKSNGFMSDCRPGGSEKGGPFSAGLVENDRFRRLCSTGTVQNRPFSFISAIFAHSSRTLFGAILMEVRLQRGPKPSIFVDFSDFGGFLSIPTLTKITKITILEQLLYEFGNLPDFQLRSRKVAIIMGVRAATQL